MEPWLKRAGYTISATPFFNAWTLPEVEEVDLLIVMGGPMSVHDEKKFPWLKEETAYIRRAIEHRKRVLGVCLGAQLIAKAIGAEVFKNPEKEIGWFPVEGEPSGDPTAFVLPEKTVALHWHGETFHLPPGATRLAKSDGCPNQAFQFGERVIGLQFHLETTPASAQALVENCRDEIVEGPFIQSADTILSAPPERYATINQLMERVLAYLHTSTARHLPGGNGACSRT